MAVDCAVMIMEIPASRRVPGQCPQGSLIPPSLIDGIVFEAINVNNGVSASSRVIFSISLESSYVHLRQVISFHPRGDHDASTLDLAPEYAVRHPYDHVDDIYVGISEAFFYCFPIRMGQFCQYLGDHTTINPAVREPPVPIAEHFSNFPYFIFAGPTNHTDSLWLRCLVLQFNLIPYQAFISQRRFDPYYFTLTP